MTSIRKYDELEVRILDSPEALSYAAACDLALIIRQSIAKRGLASIILATANSQVAFFRALCLRSDIEWDKVSVFHMDEYLGIPEQHSASFRRQLREHLLGAVHPHAFYPIRGDAPDPDIEIRRYTDLMLQYPADACVMGIGQNGHLAFNDPPADFATRKTMHTVRLDSACRRQQVGEGRFPSIADVPEFALSLTIPALLAPAHALVVVPDERKAGVVKAALEGPITPYCPASILRKKPHAVLYLDDRSSSLLTGQILSPL